MTIREDVSNFKFFEVIPPHLADFSVAGVTGATVDTQGYDTLAFTLQHSIMGSGAGSTVYTSSLDTFNVYLEHASNSTTGQNTLGAWSACTATDVYGTDIYRLMSVLTVDSWLLLDDLTRDAYAMSVPAKAGGLSGQVLAVGFSVTSIISCTTVSHVPVIGYKGRHRWVRIRMSASTNISLITINAQAHLGRPHQWPVTFAENV